MTDCVANNNNISDSEESDSEESDSKDEEDEEELIKLEELNQKIDCVCNWKNKWEEEEKKQYYEILLNKLKLNKGKLDIKNNLIKFYINELNKVKGIKGNGEGYWYCFIENDNLGVLENIVLAESDCRTFTQFKKKIKENIIDLVEEFMDWQDDTRIAKLISDKHKCFIYCYYNIVYKIRKESTNQDNLGDEQFNLNMF
tara:strand:- start:1471 stop:2067 length:597 start_codon:yes stop_codon:yes gene_type:complete